MENNLNIVLTTQATMCSSRFKKNIIKKNSYNSSAITLLNKLSFNKVIHIKALNTYVKKTNLLDELNMLKFLRI